MKSLFFLSLLVLALCNTVSQEGVSVESNPDFPIFPSQDFPIFGAEQGNLDNVPDAEEAMYFPEEGEGEEEFVEVPLDLVMMDPILMMLLSQPMGPMSGPVSADPNAPDMNMDPYMGFGMFPMMPDQANWEPFNGTWEEAQELMNSPEDGDELGPDMMPPMLMNDPFFEMFGFPSFMDFPEGAQTSSETFIDPNGNGFMTVQTISYENYFGDLDGQEDYEDLPNRGQDDGTVASLMSGRV